MWPWPCLPKHHRDSEGKWLLCTRSNKSVTGARKAGLGDKAPTTTIVPASQGFYLKPRPVKNDPICCSNLARS